MRRTRFVLLIGLLVLSCFMIFKMIKSFRVNLKKSREFGSVEFHFDINKSDSLIFNDSLLANIERSFGGIRKHQNAYYSIYWLTDGTHIFVSNLLLPKKTNFLTDFTLIESSKESMNVSPFFEKGFRGGFYFCDISKRQSKILTGFYQRGAVINESIRVKDTLYFTGNPGFINLTKNRKWDEVFEIGYSMERGNANMETMFLNTTSGVTLILVLPEVGSKQFRLESFLR